MVLHWTHILETFLSFPTITSLPEVFLISFENEGPVSLSLENDAGGVWLNCLYSGAKMLRRRLVQYNVTYLFLCLFHREST